MRPGHGSPVRASLGQAGLLPRVLPVAADGGAPAQLQLLGPRTVRKGVATWPPLFQCPSRGLPRHAIAGQYPATSRNLTYSRLHAPEMPVERRDLTSTRHTSLTYCQVTHLTHGKRDFDGGRY